MTVGELVKELQLVNQDVPVYTAEGCEILGVEDWTLKAWQRTQRGKPYRVVLSLWEAD